MAGLLLEHLWQSTLFAAAAALVAFALGRNPARVRFWVWFAAAVKFLVPFTLIASSVAWLAAHLHAQAPAPAQLELARQVWMPITAPGPVRLVRPLASPHPDTGPWLAAVWAIGTVTVLARGAAQWRALSKALRAGARLPLPLALPAVAAVMKGGPTLTGFLRPVLALPTGLVERLTPAELEAVLEHEQQHARRRDNLLSLPLMAAQALFWFHPLVWWIGRRLLAEREWACDEAVVQDGIDAETYARGLLQVCRFEIEPSPVWAAGMTAADLKLRIRRIMTDHPARPLGASGRALVTSALGAAIAVPVLAGVFVTPVAGVRMLARLVRPQAVLATPARKGRPFLHRSIQAQPISGRGVGLVLSAQPALLTPAVEPPPQIPVRLVRRPATPAFEPLRIAASVPDAENAPAVAKASPGLLRALASRTDPVIGSGVWGDRLELRTASSRRGCPTVQVQQAETALGGEAISTAFDGEVRHFVDDALASRPAVDDLTPDMARAVDAVLPTLQPALARSFAGPGSARLLGEDSRGRDVYLARHDGQDSYVLVAVDDDGRIEAALFCATS